MTGAVLYCVCGDDEMQHGQNGMIPCGCGCLQFMLDTVDPRHDR